MLGEGLELRNQETLVWGGCGLIELAGGERAVGKLSRAIARLHRKAGLRKSCRQLA